MAKRRRPYPIDRICECGGVLKRCGRAGSIPEDSDEGILTTYYQCKRCEKRIKKPSIYRYPNEDPICPFPSMGKLA